MEVKIYKMMDGCVKKNKAKFTDNNIELPDGIVVVLCCFKRIGKILLLVWSEKKLTQISMQSIGMSIVNIQLIFFQVSSLILVIF